MHAPQDLKELGKKAANQKANSTEAILSKFDLEAKEYRDEMNKKRDRIRRVLQPAVLISAYHLHVVYSTPHNLMTHTHSWVTG